MIHPSAADALMKATRLQSTNVPSGTTCEFSCCRPSQAGNPRLFQDQRRTNQGQRMAIGRLWRCRRPWSSVAL